MLKTGLRKGDEREKRRPNRQEDGKEAMRRRGEMTKR